MKIIKVADPISDLMRFNNQVPKHKAVVLVYMMKGCPHCDMLSPKWEVVKKILRDEPEFENVMSADIDSDVSNMLPLPPVMGFPMIKVLKDKKLHKFTGVRDVDPILQFLREKVIKQPETEPEPEPEPILRTVTSPQLEILDIAGNKKPVKRRNRKRRTKKHRKGKRNSRTKKHRKGKRNSRK